MDKKLCSSTTTMAQHKYSFEVQHTLYFCVVTNGQVTIIVAGFFYWSTPYFDTYQLSYKARPFVSWVFWKQHTNCNYYFGEVTLS